MKSLSLLTYATLGSASAYNRCRNQPDGTMLPDKQDPQSYVVCQNGQEVVQACPDGLYWDQYFLECQPQKACQPPQYFPEIEYSYKDGIYYYSCIDGTTQQNTQIWAARLICYAFEAKTAMPFTEAEYDMMKQQNQKAIQTHLNSATCTENDDPHHCDPVNGNEYTFYVGIESYLDRDDLPDYGDETFYYYDETRYGGAFDYDTHGPEFTQDAWWAEGFPQDFGVNRTIIERYNKNVVQAGDAGLVNVDARYRVDGVSCMYVCPGY